MRPQPPEENGHLPGDLAWLLSAYDAFGMPYRSLAMGGIDDKRADLYGPRQNLLDREWPAHLDRDAPLAIWDDLDAYHLSIVSAEMEAASSG